MGDETRRSILITGCSSGIGYASAHALAERGWQVLATCRKQADCARLIESPIFQSTGPVLSVWPTTLSISLPGDSLIFAAATFAAKGALNPWLIFITMTTAGIIGDGVNYSIGHYIGPRVFTEDMRFLKREYLDKAHDFFEKHVKTVKAYTIENALKMITRESFKGTLLFSPGFPSFDQFDNYIERGKAFTHLITDK